MPQDDAPPNYREVDVAYLRCEASSAVLFILEEAKFHPLISTQLLLGLSQILRVRRYIFVQFVSVMLMYTSVLLCLNLFDMVHPVCLGHSNGS